MGPRIQVEFALGITLDMPNQGQRYKGQKVDGRFLVANYRTDEAKVAIKETAEACDPMRFPECLFLLMSS